MDGWSPEQIAALLTAIDTLSGQLTLLAELATGVVFAVAAVFGLAAWRVVQDSLSSRFL